MTKIIIVGLILIILLFIILMFFFYKPFGGFITKKDKYNYKKRAKNFNGKKFTNIYSINPNKFGEKYVRVISGKGAKPIEKIPTKKPVIKTKLKESELTITWLGHSSNLIQMNNKNILFDPVFSDRISPFKFIGSKRYVEAPIKYSDIASIDIVIISHDHYDHLDYETILKLDSKVKKYIVPLGVERHLIKFGISDSKIINMSWWEEINIDSLKIVCTPAIHHSGRKIFDKDNFLCCSWLLKDMYHTIFESGDTGYSNHFTEIYNKYGKIDLALMGCGQYSLSTKNIHMLPEECYEATKDLHAKNMIPIHWATFALSNDAWDDCVERLLLSNNDNINIITPLIGETINYKFLDKYKDKWWRNIK